MYDAKAKQQTARAIIQDAIMSSVPRRMPMCDGSPTSSFVSVGEYVYVLMPDHVSMPPSPGEVKGRDALKCGGE